MENQNYKLALWLSKHSDIKLVSNKFGKIFLPVFLPYAFLKAAFLLMTNKYDVIVLGDGVLSIVGWALKFVTGIPSICTVHGLDLTYNNGIYRKFWPGIFLRKMDKLVAVSNATVKAGIEKGIPEKKLIFIPNGVDGNDFCGDYSTKDLERIIKRSLSGKIMLLTIGRLVKRKGVAWFIGNVIQKLDNRIIYVVAGDGPDKKNIKKLIADNKLESRVLLLGRVSEEEKKILLRTCDIFIQPNIKVEGDMEGFGIAVLEAACCGKPVIASRMEGLEDAIKDGQNGYFVETMDSAGFVSRIKEILEGESARKGMGDRARAYVIDSYSWEKISKKYLEIAGSLAGKR